MDSKNDQFSVLMKGLNLEDQNKSYDEYEKEMNGNKKDYAFVLANIGFKNSLKLSKMNINDPDSEIYLQDAKLYDQYDLRHSLVTQKTLEALNSQKNYFEYSNFKNIIRKYSKDEKEAQFHINCAEKNYKKFKNYNSLVNDDLAKSLVLAISYYTGSYSDRCQRIQNVVMLSACNLLNIQKWSKGEKECLFNIIHYLNKSLRLLPMFWGMCTRCADLDEEDMNLYQTGNIVCWINFSSSSFGTEANSDYFQLRNTRFKIFSLTGRKISEFSMYENSEREVLFSPFSYYLVFRDEKNEEGKNIIYMREISLGFNEHSILWVDDHIFEETWENKKYIENLLHKNPYIKIIPKNSTESAIGYLKMMEKSLEKVKSLKVITDMTRKNEKSPHNAGARFLERMKKEIKLKDVKKLIFTYDAEKAKSYVDELQLDMKKEEITIATHPKTLYDFVLN